jgi:hypothetical protein
MVYEFDTDSREAATAALLVYVVYRSRDRARYRVTPDLWNQVTRFSRAAAKRATNIPRFLDAFMPRLACGSLNPRYMAVGITGMVPHRDSAGHVEYIQAGDSREFLTGVLREVDQRAVVELLYNETTYIVLLVRDRLEREKVVEGEIIQFADEESL